MAFGGESSICSKHTLLNSSSNLIMLRHKDTQFVSPICLAESAFIPKLTYLLLIKTVHHFSVNTQVIFIRSNSQFQEFVFPFFDFPLNPSFKLLANTAFSALSSFYILSQISGSPVNIVSDVHKLI